MLILVSSETLNCYEKHHQQVVSATNLMVSALDKEIEKILASKINDMFKWTLNQQVLQHYLHFSQHSPTLENSATTPLEVSVLPIHAVLNTVAVQAPCQYIRAFSECLDTDQSTAPRVEGGYAAPTITKRRHSHEVWVVGSNTIATSKENGSSDPAQR
uniref:Uncharacterized protein n=1 Tax=Timema monikensis TaxID=170555 RepID=A0A7R9EK01_9NEOP|nr:unnamed protein product [Timema monikensis]